MKIPGMIIYTREHLKETQGDFAKRFGYSAMAVSYWESGMRKAPYEVIEYCMQFAQDVITCPSCNGKGWLVKKLEKKG